MWNSSSIVFWMLLQIPVILALSAGLIFAIFGGRLTLMTEFVRSDII